MCPHEMFRLWQNWVFWLKPFPPVSLPTQTLRCIDKLALEGWPESRVTGGMTHPVFVLCCRDPSTGDNTGQQKSVAELEDKKGKVSVAKRHEGTRLGKDPWSPSSCRGGSWSDAHWLSPPHLCPAPGSKEPIIVQKSPRKAFLSAHWKTELNAWSY